MWKIFFENMWHVKNIADYHLEDFNISRASSVKNEFKKEYF